MMEEIRECKECARMYNMGIMGACEKCGRIPYREKLGVETVSPVTWAELGQMLKYYDVNGREIVEVHVYAVDGIKATIMYREPLKH